MIKAIIIDDEMWSRNIIRSFGNWDKLGIEIVGEAEDGEKGLLLINNIKPDIIITDMNMPNIDGVSLLKILLEKAIEAKIIVISGYDDFEYMKQAIRSKAYEYILKPIEASELNHVLSTCVQEICLDRKTDTTLIYERVEKEVLDYLVCKRKVLNEYIDEKDITKIKNVLEDIQVYLMAINEDTKIITRLVDDNLVGLIQENIILPVGNDDNILKTYRELRKAVENGLTLELYFEKLSNLFSEAIAFHYQKIMAESKPIVVLAKEYADKMYKENISLEKIANHFFTSKEYLSGAFKTKYGINISQYILSLKMVEAKKLLEEGVNPILISERLGYQDVNYFYKVFKKYYGCTPSSIKK